MAKIIWKGFTEHVIRAPRRPLPPDAHPLIVPRRHYWLKAILLAAPVWLPVLASLYYLKNSLLQTDMRDKPWIVAGMALALLLGPLHEWFACLGLFAKRDSAHRRALQTVSFLCGLRNTHQAGALLRDVPAADAALYPSVDCLPALPCRCQSPGLTVLGVRHHVCRRACSRLYKRTLCLAAGSARWVPTGRRRRRGLLVPVVETWRATSLQSDNHSIQIPASWDGLSTPAAAEGRRCKPSWRPRHTASCSPETRHQP